MKQKTLIEKPISQKINYLERTMNWYSPSNIKQWKSEKPQISYVRSKTGSITIGLTDAEEHLIKYKTRREKKTISKQTKNKRNFPVTKNST